LRILYISYLYHPEPGALPQRVRNLTQRWAAAGHEVTVLAGTPNHPNGKIYPGHRARSLRLTYTEWDEQVRICRVAYFPLPNRGAANRFLSFSSFAVMAALRSLFMRPYDVVIGTIPQPFGPFANYLRTSLGNAKFVLDVRDLWPEGLTATGHANERSLSYRAIGAATKFLYKKADHIIAVTDGIRDSIIDTHQLNPSKFSVVRAAVDSQHFRNPSTSLPARIVEHTNGKFVVSYIGTIGNAHQIKTVIEAAKQLEASHPAKFAFIIAGSGAEEEDIREMVRQENVTNVKCTGLIDREVIPSLLKGSDTGIVSLRPSPVFETVVPTKIYEYMAAGLPIVSNVTGEASALIERAGAGVTIEGGSSTAYAEGILELANDDSKRAAMSASGQQFVTDNISWEATAEAYLKVLQKVTANNS
jgi:colanic acid biosynthesis glycosyl transferase WcaI